MGVIDILHSISKLLPEIKTPKIPPTTKERIIWSALALVLFFMLYETAAYGVNTSRFQYVDFLQTITASKIGGLLTAGIGPIVLASIFLQLFAGAGLIKLDLKKPEDKKKFAETQKVLAIVLALLEAGIFVFTGRTIIAPMFGSLGEGVLTTYANGAQVLALPDGTLQDLTPNISSQFSTPLSQTVNAPYTMALVIFQIALGSIFILYLDEIVTKYGLGSGISLFIAAGVSLTIVAGILGLFASVSADLGSGGAEAIPKALITISPLLFTVIVFLVVVYAEAMKVEIPIAFERVRGAVPKLPLKFLYVSNIPVIFASALIINVQLFAGSVLTSQYYDANKAIIKEREALLTTGTYDFNRDGIVPIIGYVDTRGQLADGLLYYFTPIYGANRAPEERFSSLGQPTPLFKIPEWVHALVYIIFLCGICIMFGLFWVEMSNMDAKSVAAQLTDSGFQIPGFRRDPRMLENILNKHIYPLTIMGSVAVGLLSSLADLTGALGTGTGILLTVGILHKMYEQLEQMNAFENYPALGRLMGDQ